MVEGKGGDDRSMGEILASIRKIVSDEESTRRVAEDGRREAEAGAQSGVFVLTGDMRTGAAPAAAPTLDLASEAKPLTLGDPSAVEPVDFATPSGLTEEEVEEIVRRVVREELQGPIGQQISRKVKALIRQEVAKALGEEESLI